MTSLRPDVDPDGLLEYSVVYTDRALNHMSKRFQQVMRDLSATLKAMYSADAVAIVPGSGTFAMEAVARQFVQGQRCLVVRNGWFSYRWSQIIEQGRLSNAVTVLKARRVAEGAQAAFTPAPLSEVLDAIAREKPDIVFAPHVETASGMLLPDDYLRAVGAAVREIGGLFVLDCIASGAIWADMRALGVDVLVNAPQKGWSGPPCAGFVMLGERALARVETTTSDSFACDLKKWHSIMAAYEAGGHAYHATLPTEALRQVRDVLAELGEFGLERARTAQVELGARVRILLAERGIQSVAARGFEAPGVVVSYTARDDWHKGAAFAARGLQIAAGVPLACDEGADFKTFRLGLFGLDKLADVDGAVQRLRRALDGLDA